MLEEDFFLQMGHFWMCLIFFDQDFIFKTWLLKHFITFSPPNLSLSSIMSKYVIKGATTARKVKVGT